MSFTIYATVQLATDANKAEATAQGCDMVHTCEWWVRWDHPSDGRSALEDGTGSTTQADMITEGFMTDPDELGDDEDWPS